jgi:hypothetical protein
LVKSDNFDFRDRTAKNFWGAIAKDQSPHHSLLAARYSLPPKRSLKRRASSGRPVTYD